MVNLEIKDLTKVYNKKTVLDNISFEVKDGEFLSILGPSGCGKTTLLKILIGIENPTSGRILKKEKDITKLDSSKRGMGIVFQNYALFPNMTVLDNVMYALNIKLKNKEEAKKEAAKLAEEKVPVTVAKINGKDMLVFFTGLYTLGVNALVVTDKGEKASMQISDIVKRKSPEDMPQGTVWVENPALHLTAAYLAQEMRRPAASADKERMAELNEELTADFKKGTFIFALQKEEKGIPLVKLKDGQLYQPAFTDILEFQKFNRENKMRPVVVEAAKVPTVLANEAQGIILNVMGVNLPLTVSRPKVQAAEPKRTIPVPVEEINKALEK